MLNKKPRLRKKLKNIFSLIETHHVVVILFSGNMMKLLNKSKNIMKILTRFFPTHRELGCNISPMMV